MKRSEHRKQIDRDLERYGSSVLSSEIMKEAFQQTHHRRSTVGEHTFRVARTSLEISRFLQKLHIRVDIPSVVIGSLCHDLGIVGRNEKYASNRECYRKHAEDSVTVAKELLEDLPGKTEEIIQRHMWPMRQSRIPNSLEGFIVSAADKYSSVIDFVKGSRKKTVHDRGKMRYGK